MKVLLTCLVFLVQSSLWWWAHTVHSLLQVSSRVLPKRGYLFSAHLLLECFQLPQALPLEERNEERRRMRETGWGGRMEGDEAARLYEGRNERREGRRRKESERGRGWSRKQAEGERDKEERKKERKVMEEERWRREEKKAAPYQEILKITSFEPKERSHIPADTMHLKQLFWSILGQSTYFAFGLSCLRVRSTNIMAIPVATGISTHCFTAWTPVHWGQLIQGGRTNSWAQNIKLKRWSLEACK